MPSPWRVKNSTFTISRYREHEIYEAIEELESRGYERVGEPSLYQNNTLIVTRESRDLKRTHYFRSKEYINGAKWVCMIRKKESN